MTCACSSRRSREGRARPARTRPAAARHLIDANNDLRPRTTRASVRLTIPALFPEQRDQPFGYLDAVKWRNYAGWMVDNGLLERTPDVNEALTNELLPGEGL